MRQVITARCICRGASLTLVVWSLTGSAHAWGGGDRGRSSTLGRIAAQLVDAASSQTPAQRVPKQIEAELVLEPRAAAPGAAIKLRYMISSYEDKDERVRLRMEGGPGWKLLDTEIEQRELFLERWENIEGELYLIVPEDARVGDRQLVRLLVEVIGESGVIEARDYVTVSRRGGARPGVPNLAVTATVGVSRLGAGGLTNAQKAGSITLSTKFSRASTFSFFYDRGLRENLSNFRFEQQRTRLSGNVRHAGWDVTFGNYVSSPGDALAGPYVLGRGVSANRPTGPLLLEFVAAQPNTIGGQAGGHLWRGRVGIRRTRLSLAVSASDFGRPMGGYTTLASVQQTLVDVDTEERLEIERRLTANAASNRVTGTGVEAELRPTRPHRLALRAGGLWLSNATGSRSGGLAAEASYAYASKPANVNVRWRRMPPTVQGISILGDELAADGNVQVIGNLRLVAYAYQNAADTIGSPFASRGDGGSVGVRFGRHKHRVEIRGNYRDAEFTTRNRRRTVSVSFGTSRGSLSLSGTADIGRQDTHWQQGRIEFYRGDLRWAAEGGTATLTITHSNTFGVRRQRVDFIGAWRMRAIELAGGAWATQGYASGGQPGVWTSVGLPVGGARLLTVGMDYSSLTWAATPSLRAMLAIRQGFTVPVPFLRAVPIPGKDSSK